MLYRFHSGAFAIWECQECAVRFWPHRTAGLSAETIYDDGYFRAGGSGYSDYLGDEPTHRRRARWYLRRLIAHGLSGGTLFDVGCAAGFLLDEARLAGWRPAGCEVNQAMARAAASRVGDSVRHGDFLQQQLEPDSVDLFTLVNVLEHLPDQPAVVAKLLSALRPGGCVAIETWDYRALAARLFGRRWHQYSPPSVLTFHTRSSLRRLFDEPHWDLLAYTSRPKPISLRHAASALWHAALRTERRPPRWLSRFWVPYLGDDLVFCLFRRRADAPPR